MKTLRKAPLALISLLLFTSAAIRAEDKGAILEALKADILSAFGEEAKNVSTSIEDGEQLKLEYKTRKFMVHGYSKGGKWSEKQHEVVGPSYRGMIVHLVLHANSDEQEQWARVTDARGATIAATGREPYWDRLIWVMPLEGKELTVRIYLSYGGRVGNTTIHKKLKSLFGNVR